MVIRATRAGIGVATAALVVSVAGCSLGSRAGTSSTGGAATPTSQATGGPSTGAHGQPAGATGAPPASSADPSSSGSASPSEVPPLTVTSVQPQPRTLAQQSKLWITFSAKPADGVRPAISPEVDGSWLVVGNAEVFQPAVGWPPYQSVTVTVPAATTATNGAQLPADVTLKFDAATVSPLRAQQILARLGYLPVGFHPDAGWPATPEAETAAAYAPPAGSFDWRFPALQPALGALWSAGKLTSVTRGAVMTFQADHGLVTDGLLGPNTWSTLVAADLADQASPHPYTAVLVDLNRPQTLTVYVDGKAALTSPVNSGIAGARTPTGTYPIYRRVVTDEMKGTMPDGTKYDDKAVPWDNYFTGGDAVHGFPRASYGSPQSNGCLELPVPTAHHVYGMLHIGDLVHVFGDPTAHH